MAYYRCGGKPEQEKTVTAGTSQKTVTPDSGKTLKKVIVDPTPTEEKTVTAGTAAVSVTPSSGKHLSKVTVDPTPSQAKSVTPSALQKIVAPDAGKLLNKVTVNGDSDLVAGNIKKGVDIFGVTGTLVDVSKQGLEWIKTQNVDSHVTGVVRENGIYVLATQGGVYYSVTGKVWTKCISSGYFFTILYGKGVWVAFTYSSQGGTNQKSYYSYDGKVWTENTSFTRSVRGGVYHNGVFLVHVVDSWTSGITYPSHIYKSTDGINWTQTNVTSSKMEGLFEAGNGIIFYECGYIHKYSKDYGTTWNILSVSGQEDDAVVVFENGMFLRFSSSSDVYNVAYSYDGITWTLGNIADYDKLPYQELVLYSAGKWLFNVRGHTYYSDNGKTWNKSSQYTSDCEAIAYENGTYKITYNGSTYTSSDCVNWVKNTVSPYAKKRARIDENGNIVGWTYKEMYFSPNM